MMRSKRRRRGQCDSRRSLVVGVAAFALGSMATWSMLLLAGSSGLDAWGGSTKRNELDLATLVTRAPEELGEVDVAEMNLLCALGLPGSEELNIGECLATLDRWTEIVRSDTEARLAAFTANPGKYDNSISLFKVVNMVLCLKNEIGVDYNPEIMQRTEFPDSRDVFIHGCIIGKKRGGCVSIPTLCVAVGRRLGYPLKLVLTREHVFFRWDDGKEVLNMEACCPGCDTHPDEYYRTWPQKVGEQEIRSNHLLKSLTPAEELGLFLEMRGHCLFDTGRLAEAQVMYAQAYRLMRAEVRLGHMNRVIREEVQRLQNVSRSGKGLP